MASAVTDVPLGFSGLLWSTTLGRAGPHRIKPAVANPSPKLYEAGAAPVACGLIQGAG